LAKCPPIPVVWHRELPSAPTSARIKRDSLGDWYVSFVVVVDDVILPLNGRSLGIDWGVKEIATGSDPDYDLPHPEHGKAAAAGLAKYQRRMARRKPASRGYKHAKLQAARAHKKVARQRQHTARVWAKRVVADHGLIAVEDFKPKFLAGSTMARKAADGLIGGTKRELVSIAQRAGRSVVMVPPAYTTQTCSDCGSRTKDRLTLRDRTFVCTSCGLTASRDRNAAKTILAQGKANLASVDTVSQDRLPSGEFALAS
jgi:putative transposase